MLPGALLLTEKSKQLFLLCKVIIAYGTVNIRIIENSITVHFVNQLLWDCGCVAQTTRLTRLRRITYSANLVIYVWGTGPCTVLDKSFKSWWKTTPRWSRNKSDFECRCLSCPPVAVIQPLIWPCHSFRAVLVFPTVTGAMFVCGDMAPWQSVIEWLCVRERPKWSRETNTLRPQWTW